jgi:DNA-directed RNA polymerase specialized sigma24 family protein
MTDDDVRELLTPSGRVDPELDGMRQALYLKLRVRLRAHLRYAANALGNRIEDCLDLVLLECVDARHKRDHQSITLAWVYSVADERARRMIEENDIELVAQTIATQVGELAAHLEAAPAKPGDPQKTHEHAIDLPRDKSLFALYECVRGSVARWLTQHRTAQRATNLAMFLRFEFGGLRIKHLHRIYDRSEGAIKQRLSVTRRELRDAVAPCYDLYRK